MTSDNVLADVLSRCPLCDKTIDVVEVAEHNTISIFSLKKSRLAAQICLNLFLNEPNSCYRIFKMIISQSIKMWILYYRSIRDKNILKPLSVSYSSLNDFIAPKVTPLLHEPIHRVISNSINQLFCLDLMCCYRFCSYLLRKATLRC